jgi:hypothetical protein
MFAVIILGCAKEASDSWNDPCYSSFFGGYEVLLKEQGTNMQYHTIYVWNCKNNNDDRTVATQLGYVTGRLHFKYKFSHKSSLFVGLEYSWFLNTLDFYGRFTNTFNANVQRDFTVKGEKMNMIGISLGVSL